MSTQKLYAGVALRETRQNFGLSQREFAERLGISLPYLSQMENNHRPVSTQVILALATEFDFNVSQLSVGEAERLVTDLKEALADSVFADHTISTADLQLTASNAPALARAFLDLHRTYRQGQDHLAAFDDALGRENPSVAPSPWEEVRDYFHYCDNYIDPIDRAAEAFSLAHLAPNTDPISALIGWLEQERGITVRFSNGPDLRVLETDQKVLHLSRHAAPATQFFQLAHQIALLHFADEIEEQLDVARFQSDRARMIGKIGLANYAAGAIILPYARFLQAAQETRHDLEQLSLLFDASIEQVAHRLSTMQRLGVKGVPFFFVRVDQAGTITKRHSATRLQFARFGGACPLWNVHRAFETPGQFLRQLAETPDGARYLCLARDVSKPGGAFHAPTRRYAIGLGCDIRHAHQLVYSDNLDLKADSAFEPIGISCRICERTHCHQRSVPPLELGLTVDHNTHGILPYSIG